jgi:hypothetical protein
VPAAEIVVPSIIDDAGDAAAKRFLEFFAATLVTFLRASLTT